MRFVVAPFVVAACLLAAATAAGPRAGGQPRRHRAAERDLPAPAGAEDGWRISCSRRIGNRAPAYAPTQPQYGGGSDLLAQLLTRVDSLEDQVRQLRGRIDETQNQLQQQTTDLSKRIDDLAFQINPQGASARRAPQNSATRRATGRLSASGAGPRHVRTAAACPVAPAAPPRARGRPRWPCRKAMPPLARRDYPAAEAAAREVLANRTSPRAYDASLLLAQALAGERQYAQAAIAFDDAYNSSRKGPTPRTRCSGSPVRCAAINEKKAACDTLSRLRTEFPQPRAGHQRPARQRRRRKRAAASWP